MGANDRAQLVEALSRMPREVHAVVDGAFFEDLRGRLNGASIRMRALYQSEAQKGAASAGPHLVPLPDRQTAERLLDCLEDKEAAVFWSWPSGEDALFRHLRKNAMVEIPATPFDAENPTFDRVLFRHADPNVMASTLTAFYVDQYAQFFGDAAGLVMMASDLGGLRKAPRPDDLPDSPASGFIRLWPDQMKMIGDHKLQRSRLRVGRYVREVAPEQTNGMTDECLHRKLIEIERSGNEHGLKSEAAHMKWAYLMFVSDGEFQGHPATARFLRRGSNPERRLDDLMSQMDSMWRAMER